METLILTCLQAQLMAGRVTKHDIPNQAKNDIIWEIKQISPKECKIDAKVEPKERTNTHKVKEHTNGTYLNKTKNAERTTSS
jgi:indole-3-glycerol phosphate synthase